MTPPPFPPAKNANKRKPFSNQLATLFHSLQNSSKVFFLWAGILFIAGAAVWVWFFNSGQIPLNFQDWDKVTVPRLAFLQNSIRQGVLPLHINDQSALGGMTDRFMGIPDVMLSPQVLLLAWMDIRAFLLLNFLLLYAAGFAGLLVFGRKQKLGMLAFTILFALFNFNGHLVAHLSIGHYTWTGYFLFSWLLVFIFDLFAGKVEWRWVAQVSVTLFAMLLQGGYHQFVHSLILLALLAITLPGKFFDLLKAILFAALLSAVRLLPEVVNLQNFHDTFFYLGGYPSLADLIDSLTRLAGPTRSTSNGLTYPLWSWEYNLYIGLAAALFLLLFGVIIPYLNRKQPANHLVLWIPAIGLILLSMDQVFFLLQNIFHVPPLTGERAPGRMAVLAFLLILAMAGIEFQKWCKDHQKQSILYPLACAGGVIFMLHDLWQNLRIWRIVDIAKQFAIEEEYPLAHWQVVNHTDTRYLFALAVGAAISLATLAWLIFIQTRKTQPIPDN